MLQPGGQPHFDIRSRGELEWAYNGICLGYEELTTFKLIGN